MTDAIDDLVAAFETRTATDSSAAKGVMMEELRRERYRRLRNMWGGVIAIIWIVVWGAVLRALAPATGGCAALGDCGEAAAPAGLTVGFAFEMFFVILVSPIAFAISPHIARAIVGREGRRAGRARATQEAARQEAEQRAHEEASRKQAQEARLARARNEFATRLGTVGDALKLLPTADAKRRTQIMVTVSTELQSLVAAYDKDATVEALRDDAVMLALASTLKSLKEQGPLQPEAKSLLEALKHAAVVHGRRRV